MGVVITSCPPSTSNLHFYSKLFSLLPVDEKPGVISKVITACLFPRSVTKVIEGKSSSGENVKEAQSFSLKQWEESYEASTNHETELCL